MKWEFSGRLENHLPLTGASMSFCPKTVGLLRGALSAAA